MERGGYPTGAGPLSSACKSGQSRITAQGYSATAKCAAGIAEAGLTADWRSLPAKLILLLSPHTLGKEWHAKIQIHDLCDNTKSLKL